MQFDTSLFQSTIIDASRYRKLKPYRYFLYFLILILAGLAITPKTMTGSFPSLIERLEINLGTYMILISIIIIITISLYVYSKKHLPLGELNVESSRLKIKSEQSTEVFQFEDLSKFSITRGSTYHYAYKKRNYFLDTNNWIVFEHKGQHYKFEFLIDSEEMNKRFERMIHTLKRKRIRFIYSSI